MSTDALYLMGISAVGAAGGKIAYVARRRWSFESWAWLRAQGWLGTGRDIQPHAKWSELFVDSNTKEFDPYRFQMAIFSLVVAVALITTSATGLAAFTVPPEMLGLLGISQAVFIGGQAMEDGGYNELDKKLKEVRDLQQSSHELQMAATMAKSSVAADVAKATQDAAVEQKKLDTAVRQAAEMFLSVYGEQIGKVPDEVKNARKLGAAALT